MTEVPDNRSTVAIGKLGIRAKPFVLTYSKQGWNCGDNMNGRKIIPVTFGSARRDSVFYTGGPIPCEMHVAALARAGKSAVRICGKVVIYDESWLLNSKWDDWGDLIHKYKKLIKNRRIYTIESSDQSIPTYTSGDPRKDKQTLDRILDGDTVAYLYVISRFDE